MPGILCTVRLCSRLIDPVLHWQVHRDHPDLTGRGRVFGKWWKLSLGHSPCCLQLVLLLQLIVTHCFGRWEIAGEKNPAPTMASGNERFESKRCNRTEQITHKRRNEDLLTFYLRHQDALRSPCACHQSNFFTLPCSDAIRRGNWKMLYAS